MKKWAKQYFIKPVVTALGLSSVLSLNACTSITNHPYDPNDPLQTVNRGTFAFNQQFDRFLLKPTAEVYKAVTPAPARKGVNNFFMNLNEIPTTVNYALQARPGEAYESLWRFLINSTVGIGGLFDVATHMGMERTTNDFGITLSVWGFSSSPYFVIPFLGPSNIRDGLGLAVDYEYFTVWPYMNDVALRNVLLGLDMVRIRTNLLESEDILDAAALDKYTLTRDAYVQYRYQLITEHGGKYTQGEAYLIGDNELLGDLNLDVSATGVGLTNVNGSSTAVAKTADSSIRTKALNASAKKVAGNQSAAATSSTTATPSSSTTNPNTVTAH